MLIKACKVSTTLKNTGIDCDISMGATAKIIAVPNTFQFGQTEVSGGFIDFMRAKIHGVAGTRVFPLFGGGAPIRRINNNKEADVVATLDDGVQIFVRYGFLNRVFSTTSGGICFAKALQSFNASGYRIIELDKQNHMLVHDNGDGTYKGLRCDYMYSPSPDPADFRNPWFTNFQVSFDPQEYVGNAAILTLDGDDTALLDENGLIDVSFELVSAASTTHILLRVKADCSEDDLVAVFGADLDDETLWQAIDKADGTSAAISAVSHTGDHIDITGTFVSGHTYLVSGKSANLWYAAEVEGYDFAANPIEVTIP